MSEDEKDRRVDEALRKARAAKERLIPIEDARLPIIAQMAAIIYAEKQIYNSDREARRQAIDQSFLLYGEIAVRLAGNDR